MSVATSPQTPEPPGTSRPPDSMAPDSMPGVAMPRVVILDLLATVPYYTAYLSRALLRLGCPVTVAAITYYLDPTCFSSRGLRLRPGFLDLVGRFNPPRALRRLLKVAETVLNHLALLVRFLLHPPQVLHVQFLPLLRSRLPLDLWLMRVARRRGARVVLTVHDLLPHDTAERFRTVYRSLYAEVDALICHSTHIEQRLIQEFGVAPTQITVIPHGPFFYDLPTGSLPATDIAVTRATFGVPPGHGLVLWQGILFPYKGVDLLLNAWALLEAAQLPANLVIAGTGSADLLAELQAQAARLGLHNVRFHFRFISTEELVSLYRAADVVVYPYRAITTSGALATGLSLGKAMVAADLPVFREQLHHGKDALLADPLDAAALAASIQRIFQEPGLRTRLESNVAAMDFGDRSWQSIARQTADLYQAITEN